MKKRQVIAIILFIIMLALSSAAVTVYRSATAFPDFNSLLRSVSIDTKTAAGQPATMLVGPNAPGWVPIDAISEYAISAIVSSEDTSFFSHKGVDFHEIKQALKKDIKERRFARGASTLSQQVVKNAFLSNEKTLWRKIREIIWARQMEEVLSKRQILAFYLNMAEFGPGIYGVGQAAAYYFGVVPADLSVRQSAFLAMLLPSPRRYHANYEAKQLSDWADNRVSRIIRVMMRMHFISEQEHDFAQQDTLWGASSIPTPSEEKALEEVIEGGGPSNFTEPPLEEPFFGEAPDDPTANEGLESDPAPTEESAEEPPPSELDLETPSEDPEPEAI